jgi:alkanesulfonate monooxygenase SsuD/methylene tetrahydromethanopterin reductase-like flavin-dependent oxidoreductase (luciferase family)
MQYGITIPPFGEFADPGFLAAAARRAEAAGWDGFFIWDHIFFDPSFHANLDPWVGLAAVAAATERIRIGTMVTPVARRRPWKLARETVSVDRLSNGRLILGVGLGDPVQWDYGFFHEETDAKIRAAKLDEGLDILTGLWTGGWFSYQGEQYQVERVKFTPTPVQQPRIPIWCGGNYPNQPPMRRAAKWDGYYPIRFDQPMQPDDYRDARAYIMQHRAGDAPLDLIGGEVLPDDSGAARARLQAFADAGLTWWMHPNSPWDYGADWEAQWQPDYTPKMIERIERGPFRL